LAGYINTKQPLSRWAGIFLDFAFSIYLAVSQHFNLSVALQYFNLSSGILKSSIYQLAFGTSKCQFAVLPEPLAQRYLNISIYQLRCAGLPQSLIGSHFQLAREI
jgi:hypothetical protein